MSHRILAAARRTVVVVLAAACTPNAASIRLERAALTGDVLGAEAAAYFTLRIDGARPDTIVGLSVAEAGTTSMQTYQAHRVSDGPDPRPTMVRVEQIPIPSTGTVRFAPGGYTAMVSGFWRPLVRIDSITLTVELSSGRKVSTRAPVLRFDDLEAVLDPGAAATEPHAEPTVADGERLYRANGCASCHGATGDGDGPVSRTLVPAPRDFRVAAPFKGGAGLDQIARTLAVGVPGGGSMPLYAHLTNHERRTLARFLVSLQSPPSDRSSTP